ncbi:MAG TPA: hypothetical protein VJ746_10030 [Nitrospira sp.]|nr:hypothetical protein [Nitrospira sp.]
MAKKAEESDEERLKKKIAIKSKDQQAGSEEHVALRALRKRLKRTQRKRRALALRKRHAAGNVQAAAATAG